jgi:hypothetical protein
MNTLNSKRFGLAVASTLVLVNVGCALVRLILPKETAITFFNSFTHVDWTSITRWTISPLEWVIGTIEVFILGWIGGFVIATVYNWSGSAAISASEGMGHRRMAADAK